MTAGWCATHQHPMTYATEHGGYWYCDVAGKPQWPTEPPHHLIPAVDPGIDKRMQQDKLRDSLWITITTRNGSLRPDGNGGYWVEPHRPDDHQCPLPQQWRLGALWQCPDGHLWMVDEACELCHRGQRNHGGIETVGLAWWPAGWWQRRRFGPGTKRARLEMAAKSERERLVPKLQPPGGRGPASGPSGGSGQSPARPWQPTDFDG